MLSARHFLRLVFYRAPTERHRGVAVSPAPGIDVVSRIATAVDERRDLRGVLRGGDGDRRVLQALIERLDGA